MWRVALGVAVLVLLIVIVDVEQIARHLVTLNAYWAWTAAGLLVTTTCLGAFALQLLLNGTRPIPFRVLLPNYWTAWAIGLVFPGQVGDMASITVLLKKEGMAPATVLGCTIADKLVSLVLMLAFALAAAWIYFATPWLLAAVLAGIAALLLMTVVAMRSRYAGLLSEHRYLVFVKEALAEALLVARRHPRLIAGNAAVTCCKIILAGLAYWCMFRAFGFSDTSIPGVVGLVAISSLVAYIPVSWNGIGTAEATGVAIFSVVGVSSPAVLASYLLLRTIGLTLAWLPAGIWILVSRQRAT